MFGIIGKLGFGFMRLPMRDDKIDYDQVNKMVDLFQARGFNYYDTAHGYHDQKSELAIRDCLTSRYPRESYLLCNKLSVNFFEKREDIRPLFQNQLEACGVDYFDVYLMHSQIKEIYEKFRRCNAYEEALELKKEGKFKHFGISFHDTPELLEEILNEYPEIEVVQIQFNYLDYDSPSVQSRRLYDICRRYNKHIIVMEPVKGGSLVKLPEEALKQLNGSAAEYAIRFAAGFEGVGCVLSGMSNLEMIDENTSFMSDFTPLSQNELEEIGRVCNILSGFDAVDCTACGYCLSECPMNISIPDLFACYNGKQRFDDWNPGWYYKHVHTVGKGKASDCIGCGACESICPQHLEIPNLLKKVATTFEG